MKEENYIENDLKEIRSSKMWLIKSIFFSITNVLAAIIILGLPIASVAIDVMVRSEKNTEMIELYSIQIDNTISGSYKSFLIGRGTIKEEEYYCCYRKTSDGGLKYYKFKMSDTTVYETLKNGEQAYVEKITDGFGELLGYKLYVPENTIIQEMNLAVM